MKILIFGGTRFLGRTIVETALAKGYEITLKTGLKLEREKELLQAWHNIVE